MRLILVLMGGLSVFCFREDELYAEMQRQSQKMKFARKSIVEKAQKDAVVVEKLSVPSLSEIPSFRPNQVKKNVVLARPRKVKGPKKSKNSKNSKKSKSLMSPPICPELEGMASLTNHLFVNLTRLERNLKSSSVNVTNVLLSRLSNVSSSVEQDLVLLRDQANVTSYLVRSDLLKKMNSLHTQKVGYLGNYHLKVGQNMTKLVTNFGWANQSLTALERGQNHIQFSLENYNEWFKGNITNLSHSLTVLETSARKTDRFTLSHNFLSREVSFLSRNLTVLRSELSGLNKSLTQSGVDRQLFLETLGQDNLIVAANMTQLVRGLASVNSTLFQIRQLQLVTRTNMSSLPSTVSSILDDKLDAIFQVQEDFLDKKIDDALKPISNYLEQESKVTEACYSEVECKNWCLATMECEEDCNLLQIGGMVSSLDELHKLRKVMRCENYLPELLLVSVISSVTIVVLVFLTICACLFPCCSCCRRGRIVQENVKEEISMKDFPQILEKLQSLSGPAPGLEQPTLGVNPFLASDFPGSDPVPSLNVSTKEEEGVKAGTNTTSQPGEEVQAPIIEENQINE